MATTIRNSALFCTCCGGNYKLNYPIDPIILGKKIKAFKSLHNDCPQTWTEPEADQTKSTQEKAMWWIANGDVGMSSKTMWNFFMKNKQFPINHPHDPDDFSRCYKLLEAVPEWKILVPRLAVLSKEWKALSENWDKLTEMYEQNVRGNWKNYKQVGMYDFMGKLLSEY